MAVPKLAALGGNDAGDSGEIVGYADVCPVGAGGEMGADVSGGIVAKFEDENSTGPEELGGLPDDAGIELSACGSAEEGGVGFVIADLAGQIGGFVAGDVRGIAGDEVEKQWRVTSG